MSVWSGFDFVITTLRSIVDLTNSTDPSTTSSTTTKATSIVVDNDFRNVRETTLSDSPENKSSIINVESFLQTPMLNLSDHENKTEVMMISTPSISRQITELTTTTYDKIIFPSNITTTALTSASTKILTTTTISEPSTSILSTSTLTSQPSTDFITPTTTTTTIVESSTSIKSTLTTVTESTSTDLITSTTETKTSSEDLFTSPPPLQAPSPLQDDDSWMNEAHIPLIIILGCIAFLLLSCCLLYYFCKNKKHKKHHILHAAVSIPGKRESPLHSEILDEINKDIDKKDEENKLPMIMVDQLISRSSSSLSIRSTASTTTIMSTSSKGDISTSPLPTTSPFGQEAGQLTEDKPQSRSSSSSNTRDKSSSASPLAASPYGRELTWMWDSNGNWSTYADSSNQSFWKTRLSEPLEPADNSYSSVDWIIQDIMESYPSLDRVKAEQLIRKEKLQLTSALLDLRAINFKEQSLGTHEEALERINILKNRFIESVYQFLSSFGHEICDDDRILYRNEINDIETKVQEHSKEVRKQAQDLETLQQYKSILDKKGREKGQKLETILEMCKEIDENGVEKKEDEEQTSRNIKKNSWIPRGQSSSANRRNSVIHQVAFPESRNEKCGESPDDEKEDKKPSEEKAKGGKNIISYSVKKEITETMTLTKEN